MQRGALQGSALCISGLVCAALLLCGQPAHAGSCDASGPLKNDRVREVIDGDTVVLWNSRKLRLIGINTPEAGSDDRPAEPLAARATQQLEAMLLQTGKRVRIQVGRDKRDKHGRMLGHLFSYDGTNLTAWLLRQGLGFHIAIPPNLGLLGCYQQAERLARQAKRGIWALPYYQARDSRNLTRADQGFVHVSGKVMRLGRNPHARYLDLPGAVTVRIDRYDLHYFSTPLEKLVGRKITVRGWSYRHKNKLYIRIRHPAAMFVSP